MRDVLILFASILAIGFLINMWDLWWRRIASWFGIKVAPESGPERAEWVRLKTKVKVERWAIIRKQGKLRFIFTYRLWLRVIGFLALLAIYFLWHLQLSTTILLLVINLGTSLITTRLAWYDNEQELQRYEARCHSIPGRVVEGMP